MSAFKTVPGKAFVFASDKECWCIRHQAFYRPFRPRPVTPDFQSYRSGTKNWDDCMHINRSAGFIGTVATDSPTTACSLQAGGEKHAMSEARKAALSTEDVCGALNERVKARKAHRFTTRKRLSISRANRFAPVRCFGL